MVRNGWVRVFGTAAVALALAMVPVVMAWGELPDPFASHWGLNGAPDAHLPLWAQPLLPGALVGLGLVIAAIFRTRSGPSAEGLALLTFLGILAATLTTSTVMLNRGASSWDRAASMSWTHLVVALLLSAVGGILGYQAGKKWFPLEVDLDPEAPPAIELTRGETAVWIGTCQVSYPLWIAGAAVLAVAFAPGPFRWLAVPLLLVALVVSHVRVVVAESGLKARLGGIIPRKITLDEVASARAIDLEPNQWGGWGYRMIPGATAIALRRGPAIEVTLKNGRKFAVTVDDASTGAALLNGLVARQHR